MANILTIAHTGLNASKKSLETAGHNLANATTEGYSRQRAHQVTSPPILKNGLIQGTGTRIQEINRVHDEFVQKRLNSSTSSFHYYNSRADQLSEVENIFNEIDNEGLNKIINKFFNSFRDLANDPENEAIRSIVRDNARLVVQDFRRIRNTLDNISQGIDRKISAAVKDINQILDRIAGLNDKIGNLEAAGSETGDLRDQRDMAIKSLSEFFRVQTYMDDKNKFVVNAEGIGTLVSGVNPVKLLAGSLGKGESSNQMAGSMEIFFEGRSNFPISNKFNGGEIASLLKVRNEDVYQLQKNMDETAFELTHSVNSIHSQGYVGRNVEFDEDGQVLGRDSIGATTGIPFFRPLDEKLDASSQISLAQEVESDLSNISTALAPNSPGDNRIAVAISKLQHEKIMDGGKSSLEEFYLSTIGKVGLETGKAKLDSEQANGILALANNLREKVSGVSIDEETANLVKFQHAYEASAKVMQTASEMFDTILAIKR